MSCCAPGQSAAAGPDADTLEENDAALAGLSRGLGDGSAQLEFAVPDAHCAACIRSIETGVAALPGVVSARVNLTKRRVRVIYDPAAGRASAIAPAIRAAGFHTFVLDPADAADGDPALGELTRAMAVAGFAAGNIMLFSISIWAGAGDATRDLFHWISAAIALPAIAYSGRVFFRSAWRALRVGRTNMDVPISIGLVLATGLSLYETIHSGIHAYFDGATMLLFFLLIGRTLDHVMRERARSAIGNLARLQPPGAVVLGVNGSREYLKLDEIRPGMLLEIRAGERVPVDAVVVSEGASFDRSVVTGESAPYRAASGEPVAAGALSQSGTVLLRAERPSTESFLARMAQMMEAAEAARTRPRRIADRAAALYAPVVHTLALATFLAWGVIAGDWHMALTNAVAVLIITCPCALALAVPIAHVVAAGRLFEHGILMKDGAALERIAEVDSVALDKTGTLTLGRPMLVGADGLDDEARNKAAALAAASTHPLSRAIAAALGDAPSHVGAICEIAGKGLEASLDGALWRLGSGEWCGLPDDGAGDTIVRLSRDGRPRGAFRFTDALRSDARPSVAALAALGLPVRVLSGDSQAVVDRVAAEAGIGEARGGLSPEDKLHLVSAGRTLMVGDGINDAPALRAAYASMAPATATDIGRSAADFVFTGSGLGAVPFAIGMARATARIVTQNLFIAVGYNAVAVPLAITGQVTPLIAAIAMSASSLIVVANALRLRAGDPAGSPAAHAAAAVPA